MDFFKSVFSDNPDPPKTLPVSRQSDDASQSQDHEDLDRRSFQDDHESYQIHNADANSSITSGGWSFGGFIRNLTSKSESVMETYRRDLQEFGSGLRKELEVAQGSVGTVGNVIDEIGNSVLTGTAQMIAQGKGAILAFDHGSDSDNSSSSQNPSGQQSLIAKDYNRFDAQVRLIQNDVRTFSLEPEDLDDYNKWRSEFSLEEKSEEIKECLEENDAMLNIHEELVPKSVDSETFWSRYYYKVYKLKQAGELRARLVQSAMSKEEEELSWDVDEDEEQEQQVAGGSLNSDYAGRENSIVERGSNSVGDFILEKNSENKISENESGATVKNDNSVDDSETRVSIADEKVEKILDTDGANNEASAESNDGVSLERKDDLGEPKTKDKEFTAASSKPSIPQEEDLEWDEIEDLSSLDEIKPTKSGIPNRGDLRKQLSAASEEDLSWDIEDDDDAPAKS